MYGVRDSAVSLEEYWEYLQINECAGYGIKDYPTDSLISLGCGDYWNQEDRFFLAAALQKSELRLEADRWLGFPVRRKYYNARQLDYSWPTYLGKYLRGVGVETESLVEAVTFDLSVAGEVVDPITLSINVNFTDQNELVIKYPSSYFSTTCQDYTIRPSCVTISSGVATVEIPRCRLLKPEYFRNYIGTEANTRPSYDDDSYFLDTVDIYRNYLNTNTGANLVWWQHEGSLYCYDSVITCDPQGACADVRQLACAYIKSQRDGFVNLQPATNDGTSYSKSELAVRREPDGIEIAYMRGRFERYEEIEADILRAIISIAHNNLPRHYCNCSVQTLWWEDDNRALEPPVRLGLGRSTWGLYYAEQLIREFDNDRNSHGGGML